jgi:predicted ATPase
MISEKILKECDDKILRLTRDYIQNKDYIREAHLNIIKYENYNKLLIDEFNKIKKECNNYMVVEDFKNLLGDTNGEYKNIAFLSKCDDVKEHLDKKSEDLDNKNKEARTGIYLYLRRLDYK